VIERGLVPFEASGPNAILMLPIGLLVACIGDSRGGGQEGMDVSVRSPEDVSFVATGRVSFFSPKRGDVVGAMTTWPQLDAH